MNKAHRIVWSEARQSYVVTHEKSATRGKPSSLRTVATQAVAAAVLTLSASAALADSCTSSTTTINNAVTDTCQLDTGESLVIGSGGSISVRGEAVYVATTAIAGGITNSGGTISAAAGAGISIFRGTVSGALVNSGSIGSSGYGIKVNRGSVGDDLSNSGTISTSDRSIMASGSVLNKALINSGTISSSGQTAIYMAKTQIIGGLTNSGTIFAGNFRGIDLQNGSLGGSLINSGSIEAANSQAIVIAGSGSTIVGVLTNSGRISGKETAILIGTTALSGGLRNTGSISSTNAAGIYLQKTSALTNGIINDGVISGGAKGVFVSHSNIAGGLSNSGSISSTNGAGIYLHNNGTLAGGLSNNGIVSGGANGLLVSNATLSGGLTNSGSIASANGAGIYLHNNGTLAGGITTNGTIAGLGVTTFTGSGGATVSGQFAIAADNNSSLDAINIVGNDTARFIGGVYAPNTAVSLASGATFTLHGDDSFHVASFANNSTLKMANTTANTITGNYLQSGILSIIATDAAHYGKLNVTGTATLNSGASFYVDAASWDGPLSHRTLSGVLSAGTLVNNAGALTVTDNSSLVDFVATQNGNAVDLCVVAQGAACSATQTITFSGANSSALAGRTLALSNTDNLLVTNDGYVTVAPGVISGGTISLTKGVSVSGSAGFIRNEGTISADFAITVERGTLSGGIANNGSIGGRWIGIHNTGSTLGGGLSNRGRISGLLYGIDFNDSFSSGLTNAGTIVGGSAGIYLAHSTVSGGLTNSGTIANNQGYAVDVSSDSSLGNVVIAGNNTARFIGAVRASRTAMSVASGATYTLRGDDDFRVASFTNNGTTQFDASTPSFSVANVGDHTFRNAGTLKVADGQLATITGDYLQTGTLSVSASSARSYGKLNVTGTATLSAGAQFAVDVASVNTLANGNTLSGVLTAGNLVNNAGTLNVTDNSSLVNFVATKNGNAVDLSVVATGSSTGSSNTGSSNTGSSSTGSSSTGSSSTGSSSTGGGSTGGGSSSNSTGSTGFTAAIQTTDSSGASGAASTLDRLLTLRLGRGATTGDSGMDAVLASMVSHTTAPTLPEQQAKVAEVVKQTLPLLTGGTAAAATGALGSINRVVQARMDSNRGMSSGDSFFTDRHLWFKPFASWADQDNKNGINGYKSNLAGAAFGGDGAVGDNNRLGLAVAYASASLKSNNGGAQRAKVDVYQLIGYGSTSLDANTEVSYQADIGNNINRGNRNIAFMGTTATSNYRSTSYHLGAGLSRTYALSEATSLTPSIRADYTHVRDGSYSENGAGALNLNVSSRTTEEMLWSADVRLAHKLKDGLTLVANGGFAYDSKAKAASVTAAYAGAPGMGFTTTGIEPDATTFRGGVGLVSTPENGPEITGRYDVERRNGYTNQTVSAKARWVF